MASAVLGNSLVCRVPPFLRSTGASLHAIFPLYAHYSVCSCYFFSVHVSGSRVQVSLRHTVTDGANTGSSEDNPNAMKYVRLAGLPL